MCFWCNVYGRLTDPGIAAAVAASCVAKAIRHKATFESRKEFWLAKMTVPELAAFEADVTEAEAASRADARYRAFMEQAGHGHRFLKHCSALKTETLAETAWVRLEGRDLIDAGICTADARYFPASLSRGSRRRPA